MSLFSLDILVIILSMYLLNFSISVLGLLYEQQHNMFRLFLFFISTQMVSKSSSKILKSSLMIYFRFHLTYKATPPAAELVY